MKKFLMALPIFMLILLSSCGTKDKREVIRDYPLTSIKEDLKLDLVQNGKNLNKDLDKSKAHSNVQIAENAKEVKMLLVHTSAVIPVIAYDFAQLGAPSSLSQGKWTYFEESFEDVFIYNKKHDAIQFYIERTA